jgi:hypothetical protein
VLSVRFFRASEFVFSSPGGANYDVPLKWFDQFGVMYGRELRDRALVWSASMGCGYIRGMDRGAQVVTHVYQEDSFSGICMPLELKAKMEWSKYFGLELSGFGIISKERPIWGWLLGICVGRF